MENRIIIETNEEYVKLITKASKENINAYGWFMRYMQIEEDLAILIKEHDNIKRHIDRCVEELKQQGGKGIPPKPKGSGILPKRL